MPFSSSLRWLKTYTENKLQDLKISIIHVAVEVGHQCSISDLIFHFITVIKLKRSFHTSQFDVTNECRLPAYMAFKETYVRNSCLTGFCFIFYKCFDMSHVITCFLGVVFYLLLDVVWTCMQIRIQRTQMLWIAFLCTNFPSVFICFDFRNLISGAFSQ